MANFDFKAATPVTSGLTSSMFFFGAASQAAATPQIVQLSALNTYLNMTTGTITSSTPFSLTQTWNAGGVAFTGLLVNITSTAAANTSALADIQVAGTSVFKVNYIGAGNYRLTYNNALTITGDGTGLLFGSTSLTDAIRMPVSNSTHVALLAGSGFGWTSSTTSVYGQAPDTMLTRAAAATLQMGAADAASPVAQTMQVQSVATGTADTAGAAWTHKGSRSTGSGASGDIIFQTGGKGAASTVQNTLITGLTIKGATTNNTNVGYPSVVVGTAALATTATDGFFYIAGGAGAPTGVPTAFTGRVPMYWDSSAKQLYIYDGAWLQPKTPAAAATVTWQ